MVKREYLQTNKTHQNVFGSNPGKLASVSSLDAPSLVLEAFSITIIYFGINKVLFLPHYVSYCVVSCLYCGYSFLTLWLI